MASMDTDARMLTGRTQMQALHDVVKAGYVRYIGMSSCYAWEC